MASKFAMLILGFFFGVRYFAHMSHFGTCAVEADATYQPMYIRVHPSSVEQSYQS